LPIFPHSGLYLTFLFTPPGPVETAPVKPERKIGRKDSPTPPFINNREREPSGRATRQGIADGSYLTADHQSSPICALNQLMQSEANLSDRVGFFGFVLLLLRTAATVSKIASKIELRVDTHTQTHIREKKEKRKNRKYVADRFTHRLLSGPAKELDSQSPPMQPAN